MRHTPHPNRDQYTGSNPLNAQSSDAILQLRMHHDLKRRDSQKLTYPLLVFAIHLLQLIDLHIFGAEQDAF